LSVGRRDILIPPGSAVTVARGLWGSTVMAGRVALSSLALALLSFALLAALGAAPAAAANWLEMNFYLSGPRYEGVLPPCDYRAVVNKIASRFGKKEDRFWNSDLEILGFEDIRETAFRPWAANTIPRRFCSAIVQVSDGRRTPINYSISEDTGMIGATWGVEWCVVGLDRNWSYNPACKMAQP
jgi:hypothetical protein